MRLQGNRGEACCSRRSPLARADIDHPSAAERQLIGPLPHPSMEFRRWQRASEQEALPDIHAQRRQQ